MFARQLLQRLQAPSLLAAARHQPVAGLAGTAVRSLHARAAAAPSHARTPQLFGRFSTPTCALAAPASVCGHAASRQFSQSPASGQRQIARILAASGSKMLAARRTGRSLRRRGLEALPPTDLEALPRINLNMLRNVPGSTKKKIRVGRGRSGRRPKTAGRGHKGTGQHGNIAFWYQGGQTPIWRLLPKRGGRNKNTVQYVPLNLDRLKTVIESGKLDASHPINMRHLWKAGAINGSYKFIARDRWGIKLLSRGAEDFDIPIRLEVARASQGAIKAIEAAGGKITCKYYNKLGLRALLLPEKFVEIPKIPLPRQRLRDWYGKPENRGVMEEHATRWDDEPAADEAKAN